jgi:hypothetical protein
MRDYLLTSFAALLLVSCATGGPPTRSTTVDVVDALPAPPSDPAGPPTVLVEELERIAGTPATSCGVFRMHIDSKVGVGCMLAAWKQHETFWFAADNDQVTSHDWMGFAGSSRGEVFELLARCKRGSPSCLKRGLYIFKCRNFEQSGEQLGSISCNPLDRI